MFCINQHVCSKCVGENLTYVIDISKIYVYYVKIHSVQ